MRAVVVYESMYGNTHVIADAIGAGLSDGFDVTVVRVADVGSTVLAQADLLVVGGPTHMHGMSRPSTRTAAVKATQDAGGQLALEPDALRAGLREWLGSLGKNKARASAAAFDTRLQGPAAFTGSAAKGVGRELRHRGYDLVAEPESFLVTKNNDLVPGERDRAQAWGASLAATRSLSAWVA